MEVTLSKLHELFDYKDGNLIWKIAKARVAELVAIEATNKLHKEFSAYKGVLNG